MLKRRLVELIESIAVEEQALFGRLSEAERSVRGEPDRWSPKDVIAHLSAWKRREVENLGAEARGEPLRSYGDFEEVNASDFEAFRDRSWAVILENAAEVNRQLLDQVEARSEAELEAVWRGERRVWQSVVGTGYTHPLMHLGQIYVDRGASEYATGLQEEAAAALRALGGGETWQGIVTYNLACHYALIGEAEKALRGLSEALQQNPGLTEWSKEDPDLASIRDDPEYRALYEG